MWFFIVIDLYQFVVMNLPSFGLNGSVFTSRWTRREVTDFYRAATTFGVVYDEETKKYDWSKFR